MTIPELQEKFPSIPWYEYFSTILPKSVEVQPDEITIVDVPSYIKGLEALLSTTPKRWDSNDMKNTLFHQFNNTTPKVGHFFKAIVLTLAFKIAKMLFWSLVFIQNKNSGHFNQNKMCNCAGSKPTTCCGVLLRQLSRLWPMIYASVNCSTARHCPAALSESLAGKNVSACLLEGANQFFY